MASERHIKTRTLTQRLADRADGEVIDASQF